MADMSAEMSVSQDGRHTRIDERESEVVDEVDVSVHVLVHWVDEDGLPRHNITQQVGVRRRARVKQLHAHTYN